MQFERILMFTQRCVFPVIGKVLPAIVFGTLLFTAQADELSLSNLAKDASLKWGPCPAFLGEACKIAVLHGDPAKSNSDVFFKVPGDYKIPLHWHTSPERMVLVSGKMDVKYKGEQNNALVTGSYAYGPAKKPHKAYCHKGEDCILFIAFEDPIDAFEIK